MKQCTARALALFVLAALTACSGGGSGGGFDPGPAITAFSFASPAAAGTINAARRTVTVTVPQGTDLTALTPTIAHNGANISPASGAAQNFFNGGFTPVTYTVMAADTSAAIWTVTVKWEPLASDANIGTYLSAASGGANVADPVILPVNINLADISTGWTALLTTIQSKGKFVALDLSACTGMTEFDPDNTSSTGKDKIVSLILPNAATSVKAGADSSNATFKNFTALKSVTGAAITSIGNGAFAYCTGLGSVSLPAATSIAAWAFVDCTGLTTVSLPGLVTIDGNPFYGCTALTTITIAPGNPVWKFEDGKLISKDGKTLAGYYGSDSAITLPAVTSVADAAFGGCTGLTTVSLPAATSIGSQAFDVTGTGPLTITLGDTPPALGVLMFFNISAPKTVTVKVPSGAAAWNGKTGSFTGAENTTGGPHWGEGFRGKGWNGTAYQSSGTVNTNINLTIQTYTP
ncbi:MAG: leucine-rich repeat domain-containing protein [Treponema sp.]|jgi:hypothetical protein|nr:leucine-rich repeat domain-containing protein [Treponema sp.]